MISHFFYKGNFLCERVILRFRMLWPLLHSKALSLKMDVQGGGFGAPTRKPVYIQNVTDPLETFGTGMISE